MSDVLMPQLSDAMEEGTIVKWLVADGDQVASGDELVEIETDKATMAYAAELDGPVSIVVPEGEAAAVGTLIARIGAVDAAPPESGAPVAPAAAASGSPDPAPAPVAVSAMTATVTAGNGVGGGSPNGVAAVEPGTGDVPATPVARRYAATHGIALAAIAGSGPRGRVTKHDVLRAAGIAVPDPPTDVRSATAEGADRTSVRQAAPEPAASEASAASAVPAPAGPAAPDSHVREPTRLQRLIARRMVEAKTTIPHFQVQTEVEMDEAIALRARLKQLVGEDERPPSLNDLIVRASAVALREHPLANGSWVDDRFLLHDRVHVGIAVAADDALVVPTIFDADRLSVGAIGAESRRLAAAVRDGSVTPAELAGGTFTVSNLGMFGMTAITPVVNPPQAAILGVGALRETLARRDGEIVDRSLLTLTLSCDHRILYGADAARFLARIKQLLEQPLRIAL